jgi:hypothetical protein
MTNIILAIFIITAFVSLVWVIATDKTTREEQNEMLDSDEMFP